MLSIIRRFIALAVTSWSYLNDIHWAIPWLITVLNPNTFIRHHESQGTLLCAASATSNTELSGFVGELLHILRIAGITMADQSRMQAYLHTFPGRRKWDAPTVGLPSSLRIWGGAGLNSSKHVLLYNHAPQEDKTFPWHKSTHQSKGCAPTHFDPKSCGTEKKIQDDLTYIMYNILYSASLQFFGIYKYLLLSIMLQGKCFCKSNNVKDIKKSSGSF